MKQLIAGVALATFAIPAMANDAYIELMSDMTYQCKLSVKIKNDPTDKYCRKVMDKWESFAAHVDSIEEHKLTDRDLTNIKKIQNDLSYIFLATEQ